MECHLVKDKNIYDKLSRQCPLRAKEPLDLRWFASYYNNNEQGRMPPPGIHKYLNYDEEETIDKNYPDEVIYNINEAGYRDELLSKNTENIMAFIGCSFTFGHGLPTEQNFPLKVSKHFNKPCLNLGMPGTGAIRHAMIFSAAANIYKIDTAVITLPNWARFHYVDDNCDIKSIHLPYNFPINTECEAVRNTMLAHFSDKYMLSATKDAITSIVTTAKLHNIKLILGSWDFTVVDMINKLLDYNAPRFFLWAPHEPTRPGDFARDKVHPGPNLVNKYINTLINSIEHKNYVNY